MELSASASEMLKVVKRMDSNYSGKEMSDVQALTFCVLFSAYSMMKDLTNPIDCFKAAMSAAHDLDEFEDMLTRRITSKSDDTEE